MQRRRMGACAVHCAMCPLCRLYLRNLSLCTALCSVLPAHPHLPALRALADVPCALYAVPLVHLHAVQSGAATNIRGTRLLSCPVHHVCRVWA